MICFEVYRNGQYVCTAGLAEFGMLSVGVGHMSHHPDTMSRFATAGCPQPPEQTLLTVTGNPDFGLAVRDTLIWAQEEITLGDEISIRIVDRPDCDEPRRIPAPDPSVLRRFPRDR